MGDIYALLNLNEGILKDFHLQAARTIDHQTELAINRNLRTLKDIEERMLSDKQVSITQQSIDEVMLKVIQNAKEQNSDKAGNWSIRELRIVSYYLMKLQGNEDAYKFALNLLDVNWRDMYFNGLSFFCLNSWNQLDPEIRTITCELLCKKLYQYDGSNRKYIAMKNHANLFEEAGPRRLAALLAQKKQDITDAPSYFCNKASTISQSYYSDVIVSYFDVNHINDLQAVEQILEVHKEDRTKKLLLADLVSRVNNLGDELKCTQLCKFANRILGDITLSATWAPFMGASESDANKLKRAKQLVNLWFNQRIIETFFEVCVQDRERKKFWLNYVSYVNSFKIIGSTATKRLLQGESRISGIFFKHFIETDSYSSQTSALVLFIKNKMLVEFSDTGSLYVYDTRHEKADLVLKRKKRITNTKDLKSPTMGSLIYINQWGATYNHEEGKMKHQGYWQERLSKWMAELIAKSEFLGFTAKDDVFKAVPVVKEEFKPTSNIVESVSDTSVHPQKLQNNDECVECQNNKTDKSKTANVIYEKQISCTLSSKWVLDNKCRVICNYKGYYLNITKGSNFVFLRSLVGGIRPTGSIWIKKPNTAGWFQIVHAAMGREHQIGFIKEAGSGLWYKQDLSLSDFLIIEI